jgi:hypothetical protein
MPNLKYMRDPYDPDGDPMIVDVSDMITIGKPQQYCDMCKIWMDYSEDGRWTYWAGERDKWYCEIHL